MKTIRIILGCLLLAAVLNPTLGAQVLDEDYFFSTAMTRFFLLDESFRPALRLIQEYDDNIGLEGGDLRQGSWKTILVPSLTLNFPGERTSLLLDYTPALVLYYSKDDELDVDQDASLKFSHYFTPRYWIHINDIFLRKETPQDIRHPDVPQERTADYNFNLAEFLFGNQPTEKFIWGVNYGNERFDYDESAMKRLYNRTGNVGEGTFRFELNPDLRLSGSYVFQYTDYDQAAVDYYSHLFRAGCIYQIARGISAQVWGGYQSQHQNPGQTLTGPYAEISLDLNPWEDLSLNAGYWHKIEDTYKISHRGMWENGVKLTGRYSLMPKVKLVLDYLGIFSYYPSSLVSGEELVSANETFWRLDSGLEFQVHESTLLKLGYRRTEDSSDFPDASYFRNQAYIEAAQTF